MSDKCWWNKVDLKAGTHEWRAGNFRAWGIGFKELPQGIGQVTIAIVEDAELHDVHSVPVDSLSFQLFKPTWHVVLS